MKKYGDDADQFHNQGTRVEESKKWHEQHQLRHNYSYVSEYASRNIRFKNTSTPKTTINQRSIGSANFPAKNNFEICPICHRKKIKGKKCHYCEYVAICPLCGKKYNKRHQKKWVNSCPHCKESNLITCPICNRIYNKFEYESCPKCKKNNKFEYESDSKNKKNNKFEYESDSKNKKNNKFEYESDSKNKKNNINNNYPPVENKKSYNIYNLIALLLVLAIIILLAYVYL